LTYRIEPIFSTPLYASRVVDFVKIEYHIDKVIHKVNFNYREQWGKTHMLSDVGFCEDIIKKLGLKSLSNEIDKHVRNYCNELNYPFGKYNMRSWIAKFNPGDYAHFHEHGDADISGVFYYKTSENDGDLIFLPNQSMRMDRMFQNVDISWRHTPVKGKLLLFPGWLTHCVKTNETNDERISFSFNIYFNK